MTEEELKEKVLNWKNLEWSELVTIPLDRFNIYLSEKERQQFLRFISNVLYMGGAKKYNSAEYGDDIHRDLLDKEQNPRKSLDPL